MQKFNTYGPEREGIFIELAEKQDLIEKFLGVPKEEWLILTAEVGESGRLDCILNAADLKITGSCKPITQRNEVLVKQDISNVTFLSGGEWFYKMSPMREGRELKEMYIEKSMSRGTLTGFYVKNMRLVSYRFELNGSPGAANPNVSDIVIIDKKILSELQQYIKEKLFVLSSEYMVYTYDTASDGDTKVNTTTGLKQSWDNLVLNEEIISLVKKDVESFVARKKWFVKNELPFRRGYLFHGPPGNGKTSVIKTILSSLSMNAYKIRLFSKTINDEALESMFEEAQSSGPNLVVLEDIDRAFPKTGDKGSGIGLHTLLNCLDGLGSQEGVITIATANEPTILDKAILKRPGRFDRVVLFDNPNLETRIKYFTKKAPYLEETELTSAGDATEGFSFAQLQETYILAGQHAYEMNRDEIDAKDLHSCAAILRNATNSTDNKGSKRGF